MKFNVGDRVQFKTWEEIEKEFGGNPDKKYIISLFAFNRPMAHLCGTFATIERINGKRIYLKEFTAKGDIGWAYYTDMLKPANTDKYELHIMSDGNKTTAVYKKNGDVVSRSEAKLHPDDEFNFKTGAQIAFDRAFQPEPENKEPEKSLRLFSFTGKCYGTVGHPTRYKDTYGRPLFVGDIVEIENAPIFPMQFVCEDEDGAFICGIKNACDPDFGVVHDWMIRRVTPFTEVKDGTKAAFTTCRLK